MNVRSTVAIAILLICPLFDSQPASACDWDTETLLQERSRFPSALEIILGKFPRHTSAYYKWRLKDRHQKLVSDPENDLWLDDIAVSLEKLQQYDQAIKVVKTQLARTPDRYESLANLGTIYIHAGQLEEGLKHIERAIEVNPDAHFGREKYQVILVKYVMEKTTDDGLQLPLGRERLKNLDNEAFYSRNLPFCNFLRKQLHGDSKTSLSGEEFKDAATGILGMMRFSRYDSPILLEALGEIQQATSAGQLAFRAYMSAAQNTDDKAAKEDYKRLANHALAWPLESFKQAKSVEITKQQIADDFRKERKDADTWFQRLANDERAWIESGEAVDVKFNEKYRDFPEAITTDRSIDRGGQTYVYRDPARGIFLRYAMLIGLLLAMTCGLVVFAWRRHRNASQCA